MASIETLISQYWMIIISVLIILLIVLVFLVRMVSKKKQKNYGIPDVKTKEKTPIFSKQKEPESKGDVKTQDYDVPLKHLSDIGIETPKTSEKKKINTWADFIIEIDNLAHSLEDAKAHEYFKMSQMYRDLTRYYFDNIQNPNLGKADMDNAWKKLEASYSKIQKLLENI